MPYIDYAAAIKVTVAQETVTAEIPLAGHASEQWMEIFRELVLKRQELRTEAADREDRTWVIVRLSAASTDLNPVPTLDTVKALVSMADGLDRNRDRYSARSQPVGARIVAAIDGWWARQQP